LGHINSGCVYFLNNYITYTAAENGVGIIRKVFLLINLVLRMIDRIEIAQVLENIDKAP